MNEKNGFFRKHYRKIILIGGALVGITLISIKTRNKNGHEIRQTVIEEELDNGGYDIWALVGTECKPELYEKIQEVAESFGKTINFEII